MDPLLLGLKNLLLPGLLTGTGLLMFLRFRPWFLGLKALGPLTFMLTWFVLWGVPIDGITDSFQWLLLFNVASLAPIVFEDSLSIVSVLKKYGSLLLLFVVLHHFPLVVFFRFNWSLETGFVWLAALALASVLLYGFVDTISRRIASLPMIVSMVLVSAGLSLLALDEGSLRLAQVGAISCAALGAAAVYNFIFKGTSLAQFFISFFVFLYCGLAAQLFFFLEVNLGHLLYPLPPLLLAAVVGTLFRSKPVRWQAAVLTAMSSLYLFLLFYSSLQA